MCDLRARPRAGGGRVGGGPAGGCGWGGSRRWDPPDPAGAHGIPPSGKRPVLSPPPLGERPALVSPRMQPHQGGGPVKQQLSHRYRREAVALAVGGRRLISVALRSDRVRASLLTDADARLLASLRCGVPRLVRGSQAGIVEI